MSPEEFLLFYKDVLKGRARAKLELEREQERNCEEESTPDSSEEEDTSPIAMVRRRDCTNDFGQCVLDNQVE